MKDLSELIDRLIAQRDEAREELRLVKADRDSIKRVESPWIPMSTPPTEADGNAHGDVWYALSDGSVATHRWNPSYLKRATHWMRIPAIPAPKPKIERWELLNLGDETKTGDEFYGTDEHWYPVHSMDFGKVMVNVRRPVRRRITERTAP